MAADTKHSSKMQIALKCGVVTHVLDGKNKITYSDGVKIYTEEAIHSYHAHFHLSFDYSPTKWDPFYKLLSNGDVKDSINIEMKDNFEIYPTRGQYYISSSRYSQTYDYHVGIVGEGEIISIESGSTQLYSWETGDSDPLLLVDRKSAPAKPQFDSQRRILFLLPGYEVLPELNGFIGSIEGSYYIPYAYHDKRGFTVAISALYGRVLIRTAPDNRFYLSFERNAEGRYVGEFVRTRLMPTMEQARKGEIEGCFTDKDGTVVPVYLSYFHPDSGAQITREEYLAYLERKRKIVEEESGLPKVLTTLLGF